jgi:hypothetical protein
MTGTVTFDQLTWIVGIITVAGGAVAGFLLWVWRIVVGLKADSAAVGKELSDFKLHAAEKYATKDGVTQAIGRMETAIERLTGQVEAAVERLTVRLDRLLEERAK